MERGSNLVTNSATSDSPLKIALNSDYVLTWYSSGPGATRKQKRRYVKSCAFKLEGFRKCL